MSCEDKDFCNPICFYKLGVCLIVKTRFGDVVVFCCQKAQTYHESSLAL